MENILPILFFVVIVCGVGYIIYRNNRPSPSPPAPTPVRPPNPPEPPEPPKPPVI